MNNIDYKLQLLWDKADEHFAEKKDVRKLIKEMKDLERGIELRTSQVSHTAAGIVLKAVRHDIEKLGSFSIEIVPFTDKRGYPSVTEVSFNKLYLTPCPNGVENYEWHKWVAIPNPSPVPGEKPYKWEKIGYDKIDLSWVKLDIDNLNEEIKRLEIKMNRSTKMLASTILNKAIKPFEELKKFIVSDEYVSYLFEVIPRAGLNQDGLMTGGQVALLNALSMWVSGDYKQIGGGALGSDYVLDQFKREGIIAAHELKNNK